MAKCHDRRKQRKVRRRRERVKKFHECHIYTSLVGPFTDLEMGPAAIPKNVRMHFLTQSKNGNYRHLSGISTRRTQNAK